ncbi:MAG: peptide chain release factor N(5)-glutamine methyltransferase [Rhizobiaceae bacterium]|nr:peptide chain release factor N(5)-glutamine methyltransferase [Rhizobiaceae bacterium]
MADAKDAARLDAVLGEAAALMRGGGIADAAREARLLAAHFARVSAAQVVAASDRPIGREAHEAILTAARRRASGEPLHRIIGRRAFYGVELDLTPATLEPRPDTEILVDRIIPHVRRIMAAEGSCKVLDLGTGTGAIALALLAEVEGATAIGVDVVPEAVETAAANARLNGLEERFRALQSNWFSDVNEKFHVIVSNPPYISAEEFEALPEDVRRYEPQTALLGGADGLEAYRTIVKSAAGYLLEGGVLGVEIGHKQRESVSAIFAGHGFRVIEQACDLGGRDRVLVFDL